MPYPKPSSHQKGSFVNFNLIWCCCCCCFKSRKSCPFLFFLWQFWTTMLCVLCRISWPHRSVLHFAPLAIYTDWAKPRPAHGHQCPCVDRWRYQRVCVRVHAWVGKEKDQVLAPWLPRAQKKKNWHFFPSVLKKVGNGELDLWWETESTGWIMFLLQSRSRAYRTQPWTLNDSYLVEEERSGWKQEAC